MKDILKYEQKIFTGIFKPQKPKNVNVTSIIDHAEERRAKREKKKEKRQKTKDKRQKTKRDKR